MPSLKSIMQDVLKGDPEEPVFSASHIEERVAALHARFSEADRAVAARAQAVEAIGRLPAARRLGWLKGTTATLTVMLSEARRGSHFLLGAINSLLPEVPDVWSFGTGTASPVRGGMPAAEGSVTAVGAAGEELQVVADDIGGVRRIVATIIGHPNSQPPPMLLVIGNDDHDAAAHELVLEIETAADTTLTLRYAATLPPGLYHLLLGNPRASNEDADE